MGFVPLVIILNFNIDPKLHVGGRMEGFINTNIFEGMVWDLVKCLFTFMECKMLN